MSEAAIAKPGAREEKALPIEPDDQANRDLVAAVHPLDWTNPEPEGRYNLVVIGAGTAGLVTAAATAGLGGRVALIEKHLMGGDCLNVGCVPSKAVIAAARGAHAARNAERFGTKVSGVETDFAAVMERMRLLRAQIAPVDSAERFSELGVDVFIGTGRFLNDKQVLVEGAAGERTLDFARAVIATGARAAFPPIPGLAESGALTNDTVFELTEQPARLVVIGGGPIGCELAQSFARLGSEVTVVDMGDRLLGNDDPDASAIVKASLERDGINVVLEARVEKVEADKTVIAKVGSDALRFECDAILVAIGRQPNIDGLGLAEIGVETTKRGVTVSDKMRTTNKRIYAAGDVCSKWKFTHAADAMARIVVQNALFFGRKKASSLVIPWATYTDPEVAHVGLTAKAAAEEGIAIDSFEIQLEHVDRTILEGETEGFVRVHTRKGKDVIVGATIVGPHAGDMIGEMCLAMTNGLGLGAIAATIHPYPATAMALKQVGDQWSRTRLSPWIARLLRWILKKRR